jgi:hypothetical protein
MLAELREAHHAVLTELQALEDAARSAAPDAHALAAIRWRLSRASGRRRRLVDQACDRLLAGASPATAQQLGTLRDTRAEILSASTRHVGQWTIDAVLGDWAGYRAASATMRKSMRRRIAVEQSLLYPLLEGTVR